MFDWIVGLVEQGGYLGIALLMLAENLFPPIPSELIMPLAGFSAAQGKLDVVLVVLSGTVGSVLGALAWYCLGRWLGPDRLRRFADRHGRWLTLSPVEVDRARAAFARWGVPAVFAGRLVPAVRTLISVPAGIAAMGLGRFLVWTTLGTALWAIFLAGLGYLLQEQYQAVASWVNPVSNAVVGALVLVYVYRVVTFRSQKPLAGRGTR
ncbi:DedA family protein [Paeniroseomonas aquatica]|uniref:DedA family protein n=1 Tax=Paeniroseomonas aquatica TaxID=373043 RepID=A0ABT8A0P1_9PROT|nr:DedA family protein [Paeniroseomonas aquatica]MDN3563303.1 DedA family protein [Paeniroseomonas aquatica]